MFNNRHCIIIISEIEELSAVGVIWNHTWYEELIIKIGSKTCEYSIDIEYLQSDFRHANVTIDT